MDATGDRRFRVKPIRENASRGTMEIIEQLGWRLLHIASEHQQQGMFMPANLVDHRGLPNDTINRDNLPASSWSVASPRPPEYPKELADEVDAALAEGWNWLELNGYIMSAPGGNGAQGWKMLTRAGIAKGAETPKGAHVVSVPTKVGAPLR